MKKIHYRINYRPIDPDFRGGLSARVIKWARNDKKNYVRYWCGGQQFTDTTEVFLNRYKAAAIGGVQELSPGKIEKRPKMAAKQAARALDQG